MGGLQVLRSRIGTPNQQSISIHVANGPSDDTQDPLSHTLHPVHFVSHRIGQHLLPRMVNVLRESETGHTQHGFKPPVPIVHSPRLGTPHGYQSTQGPTISPTKSNLPGCQRTRADLPTSVNGLSPFTGVENCNFSDNVGS